MTKSVLYKLIRSCMIPVMVLCACIPTQGASIEITRTPNPDIWPYTGYKSETDLTACVVVRIPAEMIADYPDATISSVKVGWGTQKVSGKVTGFVRRSLQGEDICISSERTVSYSKTLYTLSFGSNGPAVGENSGDLYIGYYTVMPAGECSVPTYTYKTDMAPGMQWLGALKTDAEPKMPDSYVYEDMGTDPTDYPIIMSLMLRTTDNKYKEMAVITRAYTPACLTFNEPATGYFTVQNKGTSAISSIEMTYTAGNDSKSIEFATNIASGKSANISVPVVALNDAMHTVEITKVNGNTNGTDSKTELDLLGVSPETAAAYERRPLVELFVSEGACYSPSGINEHFIPGILDYYDYLTVIYRHLGDKFMIDNGVTEYDEDTQLYLDLMGGDKAGVYIPGMSVDRSWNGGIDPALLSKGGLGMPLPTVMFAPSIYATAMSTPTFANISVSSNYDGQGKPFTVTVNGHVATGTIGNRPLNMTLYLTESGIESDSQDFTTDEERENYGGVFVHDHVIRLQPTAMYGDPVELNADGNFSMTYELEIDPEDEWNPEEMTLVAILNRPLLADWRRSAVVNTTEVTLAESVSGISVPDTDATLTIEAVDGRIVATGADSIEVYDTNGRRIANNGLQTGLYVVRATASGRVITTKIAVK